MSSFSVGFAQRYAAKQRSLTRNAVGAPGPVTWATIANAAALADLIADDEVVTEEEAESRLGSRRCGSDPTIVSGPSTTSINKMINAGCWEFATSEGGTMLLRRRPPTPPEPSAPVSVYKPTPRTDKARKEHLEERLRRLEAGEPSPAPFVAPPPPGYAFIFNPQGHAIESRSLGRDRSVNFSLAWRKIEPGEILLVTRGVADAACRTGVLRELTHDAVLDRMALT